MVSSWERSMLEEMDQGIMMVNDDSDIVFINNKGKEIIGMIHQSSAFHDGGQLNPGDFVCIVDFPFGADDGGLRISDLQRIGVNNPSIDQGDYLLAMGTYGAIAGARYIHGKSYDGNEVLRMDGTWEDRAVHLTLNRKARRMEVAVGGMRYGVSYLTSYGFMVVLDGKTKGLKFVQAHGYTIRREAIATLLRGGTFIAKGKGEERSITWPVSMEKVIAPGELIEAIKKGLHNSDIPKPHSLYELNKRLILGTLKRLVVDDKPWISLEFSEILDLDTMLKDRPPVLEQLESLDMTTLSKKFSTDMIAFSGKRQKALNMALKAAPLKYPILLQGERGTGKNRLAREIHEASGKTGPMIKVDLSSMKESTMAIALFGNSRLKKKGAMEMASKGTLYLRGIHRLPGHLQGALYEGIYKPSEHAPRIIVGTTHDLISTAGAGIFLEDLFDWISTFTITLPPLRECSDDLIPLLDKLLEETCKELGVSKKKFSAEALKQLMEYHWPGNVAELEKFIMRAVHLNESDIIDDRTLQLPKSPTPLSLKAQLSIAEKNILEREMKRCRGDKRRIMKELNISKTSLYDKLNAYDLMD
ncbi:MAG: sigma-54-dependent Fis family transcriptional regulator [Tissierellia bacterium]|nr:sigma-54-dependent Fis family transcriptional regulator [Tissierellia bacterium]